MSRDGAQLRSARWAAYATVTFILVGMVGVGGVTALAASSTVGPFELALEARHERVPVSPTYPFGLRHIGTFTSSAPFCLSGTLVDLQVVAVPLTPLRARRELTCADGSGSLIVGINEPQLEHDSRFPGTWRIEEGTGRYASLRGRGEYRGELLGGDPLDPANVVFRASWQGVTDTDTVAPTLSVATARATKLRRPAGAYSLRLVLGIRDDVEDNPVGYAVAVRGKGIELARKVGSTASGTVSLKLRVERPDATVRAVRVQVMAVDPVGNERSIAQSVKLPR